MSKMSSNKDKKTTSFSETKTVSVKKGKSSASGKVETKSESFSFKASTPFSKTFVLMKSLVRIEGVTSFTASSDGTTATVTTDQGSVTWDTPGSYFVHLEGGSLVKRDMGPDEVATNTGKLKEHDRTKLAG